MYVTSNIPLYHLQRKCIQDQSNWFIMWKAKSRRLSKAQAEAAYLARSTRQANCSTAQSVSTCVIAYYRPLDREATSYAMDSVKLL